MARRKSRTAEAEAPDTSMTPDQPEALQDAMAAQDNAPAPEPSDEGEPGKKKFVDTTGQGHREDLGDGRWLRFSRSVRWQQARIEFLPRKEGVDAKPKAEDGDTKWLREHGWDWRSSEKAWTKQLARNTDDDIYARGNSHGAAHREFYELVNRIRERNGLEAKDFGQSIAD